MIREIVQVGDPVLRRRARDLTRDEILGAEIRELVDAMRETMRSAPGVGLAAPQIGLPLRIAVIEDRADLLAKMPPAALAERERSAVPFHVIVNPSIRLDDSETVEFFEGCLSMAGFVGLVPRARRVRVECLDARANPVTIDASGWYARILQHEIDHLDGTVYIDRVRTRSLATVDTYASHWAGKSVDEVRAALGLSERS